MDVIFAFVFFSFWACVAGLIALAHHRKKKFHAEFDDDPEYATTGLGLWSASEIYTRSAARSARARVTSTAGKNKRPLWHIWVHSIELSARTTLTLSTEGVLGFLREAIGAKDIHIGNDIFDKRFNVRGSDADVVRAVVSDPAVQAAIYTLFDTRTVRSCSLDASGRLFVDLIRVGLDGGDARHALRVVRALGEALHAQAMVTPRGPPIEGARASVSSSGGAVAVPSFVVEAKS